MEVQTGDELKENVVAQLGCWRHFAGTVSSPLRRTHHCKSILSYSHWFSASSHDEELLSWWEWSLPRRRSPFYMQVRCSGRTAVTGSHPIWTPMGGFRLTRWTALVTAITNALIEGTSFGRVVFIHPVLVPRMYPRSTEAVCGLWWSNTLVRHFRLGFPLICHSSVGSISALLMASCVFSLPHTLVTGYKMTSETLWPRSR